MLIPVADAFVRDGAPTVNYGTTTSLECKFDTSGFTRQPYLRFDLSNVRGTVESAVLRLRVVNSNGSGDTHTAHVVSDDNWGETSINWNNRPALGTALASAAPGSVGSWIEFDVTDQVVAECAADQLFSAALVSGGARLVSYGTRESCSDAPQMVVKSSRSYGALASQYQLVQGPDGDDDLDGVSNLHEYALGGNPTDPLDTGHAPEYGFAEHGGTEWFTYSHPKRTAADFCLRYIVESSDDLISWETVDTVDVNTNALEPGMDILTNRVPTEGKTQQFIRMVLRPK